MVAHSIKTLPLTAVRLDGFDPSWLLNSPYNTLAQHNPYITPFTAQLLLLVTNHSTDVFRGLRFSNLSVGILGHGGALI